MSSADIAPPSHSNRQPSALTALAPLACLNCKTRKKGCDKRLPSCGYCAHRAVYCHYPKPPAENEAKIPNGSDNTGVLTQEHAKRWSTDVHNAVSQNVHPSVASLMMLAPSWPNATPFHMVKGEKSKELTTVDEVLHHQVCKTIWINGSYPKDISERYFGTIHRWLPVISRRRFQDRLVNFHTSFRADFSILLLAMCLMTSEADSESNFPGGAQEAFYLTTKMLFAHAQTHIAASVSLVQAGLLIANFEYARGMIDVAYVSIGTCARMASAAGLHDSTHRVKLLTAGLIAEAEEEQNVWWGVVICERHIINETPSILGPLATQAPNADEILPFDLDFDRQHSGADSDWTLSPHDVTSFGREAQAACLYIKLTEILQLKDYSIMKTELSKIDRSLQGFFKDVICHSGTTWGLYCGEIVFAIGAMFALHEHILDVANNSIELQELRNTSEAALRTAARMVVDVARSFNLNMPTLNTEALPPRYLHLVRAGHHLLATFVEIPYEKRMCDFNEIRTMLGCLGRRWRCAKIHLEALEKEAQLR